MRVILAQYFGFRPSATLQIGYRAREVDDQVNYYLSPSFTQRRDTQDSHRCAMTLWAVLTGKRVDAAYIAMTGTA